MNHSEENNSDLQAKLYSGIHQKHHDIVTKPSPLVMTEYCTYY